MLSADGPWFMQEPLYLKWKQWDCQSDCRYICMMDREKEREALGLGLSSIMEPASVAFSAVNLAMHFHGWLSFFILPYYNLPLRQGKKAYYEFAILWHISGLLAMNSWFWSAVFDSRVERLCSVVMAVAQLLIWAIWAGITRHPSRWKLWVVVIEGSLAMPSRYLRFPSISRILRCPCYMECHNYSSYLPMVEFHQG
ncbi:hypothetical protein PTKIN_Ptkin14bG0216100 [Pterospermum kingtungense]